MYSEDGESPVAGSYNQAYPASFASEVNHEQDAYYMEKKPKLLLMGLRRSGKSSIRKVVFHKMSANETLFLESTTKMDSEDVSKKCFIDFQVHDFPGQVDVFEQADLFATDELFTGNGALLFIIDALEDCKDALEKLHSTVTQAVSKEDFKFEVFVFIHKVDGLSDDQKRDVQRDITSQANSELMEAGYNIHLSFFLTSVYDHSIFEALSKVSQKLIPKMLPAFENLLTALAEPCGMMKAFLFDVGTKIYVASDSSDVDMQTYEMCCDMIDLVVDISHIYSPNSKQQTLPYDKKSFSCIRLNNQMVMLMKHINTHLALVCMLQEDCMEKQGIIEHNIAIFSKGIKEVLVTQDMRG